MITEVQFQAEIDRIISSALQEDIGEGDHSSLACIPAKARGRVKLLVKDEGVLAGLDFARQVFEHIDRSIQFEEVLKDGTPVNFGDIAFYAEGPSRALLMAERLVLNAMQRMSAVATKTQSYVKLLEGTSTKLLDTRKTTPGIRALEKWAVKIGGGENHRFALYDMIMLKDNHIDFAGGIAQAIEQTKTYLKDLGNPLKIIVEARNLQEVEEILECGGVYRILLDNFDYQMTRDAVQMIGDQSLTESSGGITKETLREYALCGVDYISSGALTHSVHNLDLSLKAV
jgi:nicotinate-nucleotide pyrophosphorylase (carboxylating)